MTIMKKSAKILTKTLSKAEIKEEAKIIPIIPLQARRSRSDTVELTPDSIKRWKAPPFQRPLRVNEKVIELIEEVKRDGGVLPGVITIGVLKDEEYLLDGQHRIHAFILSELPIGYCDVRFIDFDSPGEMGKEFVRLNSHLVTLRPDDVLRGLEESNLALRLIRSKCPYVGYGMIRRNDRSPILSMSALLRSWFGSAPETPATGGTAAFKLAEALTIDEAEGLISALTVLEKAWGRGTENARLWGALNLALCFWLWRRTVVTQYSPATTRLTKDVFTKCMMFVSADADYIAWLLGRHLSERDRSPAFARLKIIVAKRVDIETGRRAKLPSPVWVKGH